MVRTAKTTKHKRVFEMKWKRRQHMHRKVVRTTRIITNMLSVFCAHHGGLLANTVQGDVKHNHYILCCQYKKRVLLTVHNIYQKKVLVVF